MSTMLKHAAMTVLSKTLQTFLYKYLLEVDVEGVAMPSLLSSDASGWGVRLSNVQLRHGVMLMTLPGTKQRRCGQKKPKPPDNDSTDANTNTNSTNNTTSQNEKEMTKDTPFLNQQQQKQSTNGNDENTTTIMNSNMSSRAPTPPVKCSQQMMSCLNRDQTSASTADSSEDEAVNGMVPSIVRRNSRTAFMPIPTKPTTPTTPTPTKTSADPLIQHNVAFDTTQLKQDHAEHFINNNNKTTNNENESTNEQTNNNEEEYDWMEQEMVLKLGTGGRIGTLDIRLVGKDLHIMVEGACLTVEACPKEEEEQSNTDTTTTSNNNTTDDTEDQKTSGGGTKKTKPPTTNSSSSSSSTKKQPSELNMAERILENSVIAKALSAIPHLLLRDCTVRLIVRENSDSFGKDVGPEDTVVEFGVELFSVTSGDDFMEGFGTDEEKEKQASDVAEQTEAPRKPSLKRLEEEDENEYLLKRIRTGKGHESGISVKVYPPAGKIRGPTAKPASPAWAIHSYLERSKFCFFRCSGLDIRARIYLGKIMEIARRNNDYAWYGEEYDEYTIDSMLFGVDYIAPGPPPPPPPPLNRIVSDGLHKKRATGTELYTMDENGVQSNKVRSAFHKVARGLIPTLCKKNHLPGDHCPYCWENTARPNSYSVHPLDSKTPLPGVVFSLSLHEPLEINVDRSSLEVLGNLNSLFTKKEDPAQVPTSSSAENTGNNAKHNNEEKSGSKKWSFGRHAPPKKESLKDAYPSYMVPENIEFMGVYLSKIILRLHVMRGDGRKDTHLSFRYWETVANCVTADLQSMKAKQKVFRDVRLGLGFFSMTEFRGIESKKLISLGLACEKSLSEADSATTKLTSKSSWPSMAALLLHVPATAESVKYESKEKHGMQMRYVSVLSKSSSVHAERSSVNIRLGVAIVATNYSVIQDVSNIVSQSTQSIFGVPRTQSIPQKNRQENAVAVANDKNHQSSGLVSSSLMQYKVQIDGGSLVLAPLVHAQLPSTKFCGELSSESGMFFETVLKNMELEYGVRAARPERNEQMLTLTQLAALPESVRLRILLLLKDLSPVEKALEVTKESNSFLRCRAVNRAILSYGTQPNKAILSYGTQPNKSVVTPKKKSDLNRPSQRQEMLAEFMKLDDHALEELWKTHQSIRNKKKALQMDK